MRYSFADVSTKRASIGDIRERLAIETVDMTPDNDFSGNFADTITTLATVWGAVIVKNNGLSRMLGINTDKTEPSTHAFYIRFWDDDFLEARYISWKGNRYRILDVQDIRGMQSNFQLQFLGVLKGDTTKEANTWG